VFTVYQKTPTIQILIVILSLGLNPVVLFNLLLLMPRIGLSHSVCYDLATHPVVPLDPLLLMPRSRLSRSRCCYSCQASGCHIQYATIRPRIRLSHSIRCYSCHSVGCHVRDAATHAMQQVVIFDIQLLVQCSYQNFAICLYLRNTALVPSIFHLQCYQHLATYQVTINSQFIFRPFFKQRSTFIFQ
jgi:hypothetical protein